MRIRIRKNVLLEFAADCCLALLALACASVLQRPATVASPSSAYVLTSKNKSLSTSSKASIPATKTVLLRTHGN